MKKTFSQAPYQFEFLSEAGAFQRVSAGSPEFAWLHPGQAAELFAVYHGGQRHTAANLQLSQTLESERNGARQVVYEFSGDGLRVEYFVVHYPEAALIECWPVVWNSGSQDL